jgi:hypothetical protein
MLFSLLSFAPATNEITVNLYSEKVDKTRPNIVFMTNVRNFGNNTPTPFRSVSICIVHFKQI